MSCGGNREPGVRIDLAPRGAEGRAALQRELRTDPGLGPWLPYPPSPDRGALVMWGEIDGAESS